MSEILTYFSGFFPLVSGLGKEAWERRLGEGEMWKNNLKVVLKCCK